MEEIEKALAKKVALVTGAGKGIGAAIAKRLALEGTKVAVNDINFNLARTVAEKIQENGGEAFAIKADVIKADEVSRMVDAIVEKYVTIDILVNNAGVLRSTRLEEIKEEEWNLVIDVNLKGTFNCSQAVLPLMREKEGGRIVNLSSSAGKSVSTLGGAHYTAAKAGILGLTRHMAKESAPYGINVNAVCPGLIDTEMVRKNVSSSRLTAYERSFPISRLGTPAEVAALVFFLVSEESSYITGASIDINGGDLMI